MPDKPKKNRLLTAYLEYKNTLAAYIARRIIRSEDVDDILQEAYMQLHVADTRETVESPKAYLFIVARNILSTQLAQQTRHRVMQLDEASLSNLESNDAELDQDLYHKMKLNAFLNAVEQLPPQCKRVFLLRKIKGLSHAKISTQLGISKRTVERHITLAMSRLSNTMGEYSDVGPASVLRLDSKVSQ